MSDPSSPTAESEPWLAVAGSRDFVSWLTETNVSLGFSTYQTAKLFLIGRGNEGRLSVFERTFSRCMGLYVDGAALWMSSEFQLWRFENALASGRLHEGFDRLYIPRVGYTTGKLDIHDVVVEADGRTVFVNTMFNCLATLSRRASFTPLWRPPWISKLAAEDRCHLNGVALRDGRVRYVTAFAQTDVKDAWRAGRTGGGCIVDAQTGDVIARGLSMPHSPRYYAGQLWVLNSGTGEFGRVDLERGEFQPITFCPGYLRGLAFVGDYALVTLSQRRKDKVFAELPLDEALARRGAQAQCGIQVIHLPSGQVAHWLWLQGMVDELYDVVVLPGAVKPMMLGFKTDEIKHTIWADEEGRL